MAILRERIETSLAIDDAFTFIADFANASQWDPGVATSARIDSGPLRVGTRFELGVRMRNRVSPMTYEVTTLVRGRRVVLAGSGSGVDATDDIQFESMATGGTRIDYLADIRLRGILRLAAPFAGGAFATIARRARDGMQRALDDRAAVSSAGAATVVDAAGRPGGGA